MPEIISDILSLLKINKLHLLKDLYTRITIPLAVFNEIEKGREKDYYTDLSQIKWITIKEIKDEHLMARFGNLDDGEAEVLVLAKEQNADLVLMDELMGRKYAKNLKIKLTGTIGILLKAKEMGKIKSVKNALTELIEKGTWISPKLLSTALKLSNEEQSL